MSDSDFLHGEPLAGKYEVAASISRGNRFDVYLAYHTRFGWPVALKILQSKFAQEDDLASQVQAQLELVSKQAHPNLVPIYEVGLTTAGQPFAAMAYLEGSTLAQWTRQLSSKTGPTPVRDLLDLARQIALGAATLHRAGVIHPDLNPGNVLMNDDSMPVLAGLGMPAVAYDPVAETSGVEIVQYRAPEVRSGQAPDAQSNVYSLGVILYELLGLDSKEDRRWPGGTAPPMPLERVREDLSAETAWVVNTCLKKDVDERFQSMEEVIAGLDKALGAEFEGGVGRIVGMWEVSSARRSFVEHRRIILAAVPALLLALFVLVFLLMRPAIDQEDASGQGTAPFASTAASFDLALPRRAAGQIELLEPVADAVYQPGDELHFGWCWSEQPREQERFAVYVVREESERRLNIATERVDVFCYKSMLTSDDFSGGPGELTWRIKLVDEVTAIIVVASEWRSLILTAPELPDTATPTPTPSPTPSNTPTATPTASPTPTDTPTDTPTATPTATLSPATPTATEPPPTATSPPPPTSPPPTSRPPTAPPPTAPPSTPTAPPPIPTATPP